MASGEDGGCLEARVRRLDPAAPWRSDGLLAAAELIQLCALAIRPGTSADAVGAQLSIHSSHGERLLKAFGADLREHGEP